MGRTYLFECPRCEYRVAVAGGVEQGMLCRVQTIRCRDCSKLVDVPIRVRVAAEEARKSGMGGTGDAWQERLRRQFMNFHLQLPVGIARRDQWLTLKPRCPDHWGKC